MGQRTLGSGWSAAKAFQTALQPLVLRPRLVRHHGEQGLRGRLFPAFAEAGQGVFEISLGSLGILHIPPDHRPRFRFVARSHRLVSLGRRGRDYPPHLIRGLLLLRLNPAC